MAYSILHRGPVPNFLDPLMFEAITKDGLDQVTPTLQQVADYDIREKLERVRVYIMYSVQLK